MAHNTTSWNLINNTNGTTPRPSVKLDPPISIVDISLFCILGVMIVFANSLMIGAFYVNTRLRTRSNLLLLSLAVADMMIGTIALPLWVYFLITFTLGPVITSFLIFNMIFAISSVLNFTAISLERCYALIRPIKHRNMRKGLFITIIVVSWILATLAGTAIKFWGIKYKLFYGVIVAVVFYFVPLAIIVGAYGMMFHVARTRARGREVGSFKKNLRIAMTVAVVTGLFFICWTPFFALRVAYSVCGITKWMSAGCLGLRKLPVLVLKMSLYLRFGNSVCNPIVYSLRNEEFRRTFRVLLLRLFCRKVRVIEYDKNLNGGVRKVRSSRRQREALCENVQLRSVRIIPSPQQHSGLFDTRESRCEAVQNSNPIQLEVLKTEESIDNLEGRMDDRASHTLPSDLTSASHLLTLRIPVADVSSKVFHDPAAEHDEANTGNNPGDEAIPKHMTKQDYITENITLLHKRSTGVFVGKNETHLHNFTESNSLEKQKDSKITSTLAPFDGKRSLSEMFVSPSGETVHLKLRSQSFPW